ncbi:hypothetical protein CTEN210_06658 [Chaetoceros tenuissimus]|uniref:Methyltransferase FkbM domain-containing protein n=1 Tax=Chaetoceros tenuissimus TaxID=426638 RepID=A0AAD3CQF6_9STRA|nr:hypothetical protein CTEN210_06658 [Chaetoceros tenuissimus]
MQEFEKEDNQNFDEGTNMELRMTLKKNTNAKIVHTDPTHIARKRNTNMNTVKVTQTTALKKKNTNAAIVSADPILEQSVLRNSGEDWQVAQFQEIKESNGFECSWTRFRSSTGKSAQMCIYPTAKDKYVSGEIRSRGRWSDCDVLPKLWNQSQHKANSIYLEIGANIGSCVMEMLLSTDAKIIAFEPHPMNLYKIQQTMARMDDVYKKRLKLYPIGLGSQTLKSTIYAGEANMGNSVVGTFVKDWAEQTAPKQFQFEVNIERLDSILNVEHLHIPLIKMDVQGFECNVMAGMSVEIAKSVEIIKFEHAKRFLEAQKCTNLLPTMRELGFDIYDGGQKRIIPKEERTPCSWDCEFIAKKRSTNMLENVQVSQSMALKKPKNSIQRTQWK